MAPLYYMKGMSPLVDAGIDPDEEAARQRDAALATSVPAVPSPAPVAAAPVAAQPPIPMATDEDHWANQPSSDLAPVAPTIATVAATTPKTWDTEVHESNAAQGNLGRMATQALSDFADRSKALQARKDTLLQQRQATAQPIVAYDSDGKVLPQYKPTLTQKIMRGLTAVQRGGVLGAINPATEGLPSYTAPNSQYGRDVAMQQARVGAIDAGIAATDKDYKDAFDVAKGTAQEVRSNAGVFKDIGTNATNQTNADTHALQIPINQENADNDTPEAKAQAAGLISQAQMDQRTKTADALHMKGMTRTLYLANNRIPDPRQATSEDIARARATEAWHRDNPGKMPTVDDINRINQAAGGRAGVGASGSPSATGGDLLQTMNPAYAGTVKATANGDIAMPSASSRAPGAQKLRQDVLAYDPTYTDARYVTKQNFKDKGDADTVASLSTAMAHAHNAIMHSHDAGFAPMIGHPKLQAESTAPYAKDVSYFTEEMGKLVKRGVITKDEYEQLSSGLDDAREGARGVRLNEIMNNVGGRIRSIVHKYETGTKMKFDPSEYLTPEANRVATQYHLLEDGGEAGAPQEQQKPAASKSGGDDWFSQVNQ